MKGDAQKLGLCPLCGREMIAGPSVDRHHWVPKSAGGRVTDDIHLVCHRMIHRVFGERELAREFADPAAEQDSPLQAAKAKTARFYAENLLGETTGLAGAVIRGAESTLAFSDEEL